MALSLDALTPRPALVPPRSARSMPAQDLASHIGRPAGARSLRSWLARFLTFGGAVALTAYAGREMVLIVSVAAVTPLQWVLVGLFVVTFGWIALAGVSALVGIFLGGMRRRARPDAIPTAHTALVMPIFNENPARPFASLHAMGAGLADLGYGDRFEIFVLSDTTDPDIWVKETAAIQHLRDSLAGKMRVWYRRRHDNGGKKAGNLKDFVTSWGGRYEYMIVLDADSLMSADTLAALVCEMQADPRCGILQTSPRLLGGETLLSRLQQFAGAVYGPVVARGIAAWQGEDGNYWGHNAILRLEAFAAAAGLPVLPGRKPFGGEILSHDFVEAALVRRAGWSVRMLTSAEGSWEDSPPSLVDLAARDRRWAQGNLQHLRILRARGFKTISRIHMLMGAFGYLASPLWLALILVGAVITAQVATAEYDYFSDGPSLFPHWPVFDSERMLALFVLTAVVLLLPKLLGLIWSLGTRAMRRHGVSLLASSVLELVLSLLYAPLLMLIQSQQLWEILQGRDSGWRVQHRTHHVLSWGELCRRHLGHTIIGAGLTALLYAVSIPLLAWMSPTLIGLVLAVPVSALSGNLAIARVFRRFGLLNTPEERALPRVAEIRDAFERALEFELEDVRLETLVLDTARRRHHFDAVLAPVSRPRGKPDVNRLSVQMKIAEAGSAGEVMSWLSDAERMVLLSDPDVFESLLKSSFGVIGTARPEGRDAHGAVVPN